MNIDDVKKISEIQIVPIRPRDGLVGFASFIYDESFHLGSIGIYTRPGGGYRLTYPTRKIGAANVNIFYPINSGVGILVEELITRKYEEIISLSISEQPPEE